MGVDCSKANVADCHVSKLFANRCCKSNVEMEWVGVDKRQCSSVGVEKVKTVVDSSLAS